MTEPTPGFLPGTPSPLIAELRTRILALEANFDALLVGDVLATNYGDPGQAALDAALAAIGSEQKTLVICGGDWAVTKNFPANVAVAVVRGSRFTGEGTVDFHGPLYAGQYQIFAFTGAGHATIAHTAVMDGVKPHWWGAINDGVTDCTAAIQAAITAAPSQHIKLGQGAPKITDTITIAASGTHIDGEGVVSTNIYFHPTSAKPCFVFQASGAGTIADASLSSMSFTGFGTYQKTAIKLVDTRRFNGRDIYIGTWTGNTSIGINVQGRDFCDLDNVNILADKPIYIEANPHSAISLDNSDWNNMYLIPGAGQWAVTVGLDCNITSWTMNGHVACATGAGILIWDDHDHNSGISGLIDLGHLRYEQGTDADHFAIYIDHSMQDVVFRGVQLGDTLGKGFFFRGIWNLTRINCSYGGTGVALDVDDTCPDFMDINCHRNAGSSETITGLTATLFNEGAIRSLQPTA